MFLLVRTADIVKSEACIAENKHWNDMTSPSVDYVIYPFRQKFTILMCYDLHL